MCDQWWACGNLWCVLGPSYSYRDVDFNRLLPRCTWGKAASCLFLFSSCRYLPYLGLCQRGQINKWQYNCKLLWNAWCRYSCCSNSRRRRRWNEWAEQMFPKVKSTRTGTGSCCLSQGRVEREECGLKSVVNPFQRHVWSNSITRRSSTSLFC